MKIITYLGFVFFLNILVFTPVEAIQYRWISDNQVEVVKDDGNRQVVLGRMVDLSKNVVGLTQKSGVYLWEYLVIVTPDQHVVKIGDQRVERRNNNIGCQILSDKCHGFVCEYDTTDDHTSYDRQVCLLTTKDTIGLDACVNGYMMPGSRHVPLFIPWRG